MTVNPRAFRIALATILLSACASSESSGPTSPIPLASLAPGLPAAWFGGSTRPDWYEVGLDAGVKRSGTRAGYLRSTSSTSDGSSFASLGQSISAIEYRGKRVRFTGFVHTEGVTGTGAGLWMRIDAPTTTAGFDNMIGFDRAILGTRDWTPYSIVLDVPMNAIGVTVGVLLNGRGVVRLDDARLELVALTVPTTGTGNSAVPAGDSIARTNTFLRYPTTPENLDFEGIPSLAASTSSWLASVAKPFTTDAPGSGFDDLAEMGTIVGDARVVGFGEATHGTREFFRMKHRAFEYLVERHGFTHFTIEATMPESRAMDRYVTHGEGDPARLLAGLYFWTWNTEEVLDLVKWMRAYNVRVGAPKLRFVGFDMQSPQYAVDSARTMLARLDPALGARAQNTLECLAAGRSSTGQYASATYRGGTTALQRSACADSLRALSGAVTVARPQLSTRISAEDLDWLEQYITLVRQWERMAAFASGSESSAERDRAMAENLLWITQKNPGARVFAWAHNYHVSRRPGTMGEHVGRQLGASYRVFAFTFGTGRFNAVGQSAGGALSSLGAHSIASVDSTSLEAAFSATNQPRLIFDARRIRTGGAAAARLDSRPLRMRTIGAVYAATSAGSYYEQVMLPADYDALIWFATTSQSVLLPF